MSLSSSESPCLFSCTAWVFSSSIFNTVYHAFKCCSGEMETQHSTDWFSFLLPGNLAQAEAVGREALQLIPNDHSLMFSLANVLGKSQKYKVGKPAISPAADRSHSVSYAQFSGGLGQSGSTKRALGQILFMEKLPNS